MKQPTIPSWSVTLTSARIYTPTMSSPGVPPCTPALPTECRRRSQPWPPVPWRSRWVLPWLPSSYSLYKDLCTWVHRSKSGCQAYSLVVTFILAWGRFHLGGEYVPGTLNGRHIYSGLLSTISWTLYEKEVKWIWNGENVEGVEKQMSLKRERKGRGSTSPSLNFKKDLGNLFKVKVPERECWL